MRIFLAVAAIVLSLSQALADTLVVNDPSDGWLNLRAGPGSSYNIVQRMDNGLRVQEISRSGNWSKVRLPSSVTGWAYRPYLKNAPKTSTRTTASALQVYSPNDGYLNLRRRPTTNSSIIREMYNGQQVTVLDRSGNWLKVRHSSGSVGWAYAKYLVSPTTTATTRSRTGTSSQTQKCIIGTEPGCPYEALPGLIGGLAAIGSVLGPALESSQNIGQTGGTRVYQCEVHCDDVDEKVPFSITATSYNDAEYRAQSVIGKVCKPFGGRAFLEFLSCQ